MPTPVLYLEAYLSRFFYDYNPLATSGKLEHRRNGGTSENDFLSRPSVWAEDVVEGINQKNLKERKRLVKVGQFLSTASFYGLPVEKLAADHLSEISSQYVSVDYILSRHEEISDIPRPVLDTILAEYNLSSKITKLPIGDGKRAQFVHKSDAAKFWRNIYGQLRTRKIRSLLGGYGLQVTHGDGRTADGKATYIGSVQVYPIPSDGLSTQVAGPRVPGAQDGDPVRSDLGRRIMGIIETKPPGGDRRGLLRYFEQIVIEYSALVRHNNGLLGFEAQEIVRVAINLEISGRNFFTRGIRRGVGSLERILTERP